MQLVCALDAVRGFLSLRRRRNGWRRGEGRENQLRSMLTLHFIGVQPNGFMKSPAEVVLW